VRLTKTQGNALGVLIPISSEPDDEPIGLFPLMEKTVAENHLHAPGICTHMTKILAMDKQVCMKKNQIAEKFFS
jgi:hypothetical protein